MNSIRIELQENNGHFSAHATWGQSAWHRDPMTAISELFGKAIPFAVELSKQAYEAQAGERYSEP